MIKDVIFAGTVTMLALLIPGCDNSGVSSGGSGSGADNAATIVGAWKCATKTGDGTADFSDVQSFSADGWFSSSKYPEGKKYQYRMDGDKLTITIANREWVNKVAGLTSNTLEYYNDKPSQPVKVSCQK